MEQERTVALKRYIYLMLGIGLLVIVVVFFLSFYFDPIVNYYGVRMRESQLVALLQEHPPTDPDFGLFCYAQPLTNLHEHSICFNSAVDLDTFITRKSEIESQLYGRS